MTNLEVYFHKGAKQNSVHWKTTVKDVCDTRWESAGAPMSDLVMEGQAFKDGKNTYVPFFLCYLIKAACGQSGRISWLGSHIFWVGNLPVHTHLQKPRRLPWPCDRG